VTGMGVQKIPESLVRSSGIRIIVGVIILVVSLPGIINDKPIMDGLTTQFGNSLSKDQLLEGTNKIVKHLKIQAIVGAIIIFCGVCLFKKIKAA